jgi:molybdopterin/thiamine biosynthesis adenylyltransferase
MSAIVVDRQGELHSLVRFSADSPDLRTPAVLRPSAAASARSSPEFSALAGKSVAIVGLGSVGSKMAESLARSGVGQFMLVDHDVFLPENVVRNGLDLHNTCELKVHAVAQRLTKISPSVKVDYSTVHLVGQESNAAVASAVRRIGQCDVIIDATANPRVFTLLAHLAIAKEKPLVWMEVFGGNLGGMIARSRPSKDASPFIVRDTYAAYTRDHPFDERVESENYDAVSDGQVVIASDAQVSVVAGYAVQFALDSLLEREPSRFPYCLYLIGMERRWVFEVPMHTIAIETPPPSAKADEVGDPDENAKTIAFLAGLLGGSSGEAAATS